MKTIGVLGGMGPVATVDFFARLVRMVGAGKDQDHPPCVVYNATQTPDRTGHLTGDGADPAPALGAAARVLEGAGADLITIPCNSAHAYLEAVREAVGIPVLDMIDLAAREVARRVAPGTHVAILAATGTVHLGLYDRCLEAQGLVPVALAAEPQANVMAAIRAIKGGRTGRDPRLMDSIEALVAAGAQALVLGCTELPLAVDPQAVPLPVIDASEVLARTALQQADCRLAAA